MKYLWLSFEKVKHISYGEYQEYLRIPDYIGMTIIQKIAGKNWICRIYEIVTYYSRLVKIMLCKTRIDFDHKKLKITGLYEVNYHVDNDEAILREYYFNKVSILNWMDKM